MSKADRHLKTWFDGVLKNPHYLPDNNTVNSAAAIKHLMEIAILTDQFDKLKTDKMRMWLEFHRDMVSPTGMPPTSSRPARYCSTTPPSSTPPTR